MDQEIVKNIKVVFEKEPKVGVVYFFGSRNRGDFDLNSDYDFAVYFIERDVVKRHNLLFKIIGEISHIIKSDNLDVISLNDSDSLVLKYKIISEGTVIFEREPYKIMIEPQILNEYFDYKYLMAKYNLTKVK